MRRRHFLQLGASASVYGLASMSLPAMALSGESIVSLPLNLPERLQGNPLLDYSGLPQFDKITPSHVKPAIDFLLQYSINAVERLTAQPSFSWENFYAPLEDVHNKLDRSWAMVTHLYAVKNSDELRKAYNDAEKALTEYNTWYGMYQPLYHAFEKLKAAKAYKSYNKAQKKAIDNALLDFQLSGVALKGEQAKRYGEIASRLSALSTQFDNNVLDANMGWELVVDEVEKLSGLPETALAAAKKSADDKGQTGYRFTLDYPSYFAVVAYADDRSLREEMFAAYRTRASDKGPTAGKWDNSAIMNEIISLRLEMAELLGFETYAHYALARRMAENPAQVLSFLRGLLAKARPKAVAEMAELADFGKGLGLIDELQAWDTTYLSEKQKQARYNIDKEALRVYFPVDKVLTGLFGVAERLFGVKISERTGVAVWHEDVRYFEITREGQPVASFYMDLYAREHKRGGAWMSSAIERRRNADGSIQLPVAQLVCNFGAPVDGKPALLLHDEVETLFHEFGHGLHQMLTTVEVMAVSGINGVPWDAVEFPVRC